MSMILILSALLGAQDCCSQDKKPSCCQGKKTEIVLPLQNVEAGCCTSAVADALKKHVDESAAVPEPNRAVFSGKKAVLLSDVETALEAANAGMGKQMRLTYRVDESKVTLRGSTAIFQGNPADLEKAFPKQAISEKEKGVFAVTFDSESKLSLADIRKAGMLKDVEFRAIEAKKCCRGGEAKSGCCESCAKCKESCSSCCGENKNCCESCDGCTCCGKND